MLSASTPASLRAFTGSRLAAAPGEALTESVASGSRSERGSSLTACQKELICLRLVSRCAALFLIAALSIGLIAAPASAQTAEEKTLTITSAPGHLAYLGEGRLRGTLEGWVAGDKVNLQKVENDRWKLVSTRAVNDQGKVSFPLSGMRRSRTFRLTHVEATSGATTASKPTRVRVAPRMTLQLSRDHVMQGRVVTASGVLYPIAPSRTIVLQQKVEGTWKFLGKASVREGRYSYRFSARHLGYRRIRGIFRGDSTNTQTRSLEPLRVYNPAIATWYGPGLYGNRTACGQTLGTETVGVAHRTLPCGTEVGILYRGRTVMLEVIDRGPYSHADWDLTEAAARRLRFRGSGTIGVDPNS